MNLLENFLSQVNNTSMWLTILLDASMKGAVILLAASVLCFFLRRTSAAARHLVWSLALISVLALPVFSMLLPGWNLPVLPNMTMMGQPTDADKTIDDFLSSYSGNAAPREYQILPNITTMEQQAVETKTFDNLLSTYSGSAAIQENQLKSLETVPSSTVNENPNGLTEIQAQISTITPNAISESPSAGLNWSAWLVIIWLIGALSVFARMLTGVIGVHIVKRCAQPVTNTSIVNLSHRIAENLGLKRRFTLLKSSRTRVPMTLGFFKPAVLLPEDAEKWSPSRQKVVLLHELAHIKRSDIVYNVISQAVAALYWFNPLVWYAHHVLYAERERACDDYVIVSGVKSIDYANHLLDIARSLRSEGWISFAPVTMARRSQLEWRMRAILDPKKCRRALKPITTIATCLIVASLVLPFAAMQPVEKDAKITGESTSKTEKINIPLTSVTDVEKNLPEESNAQQQQQSQLIANVIRSLIDSLKSENTEVKMESVYTLSYLIGTSSDYLKDYSLLDALIPLMKEQDAEVRLGTLRLVEKFEESEAALEALLDAIHDENAKIREGTCDFLGDRIRKMSQTETAEIPIIDTRILNALKDAMNDEEPKVRMTALEYFRYMPESNALELLIAALKDKDERVRIDAVEYLSRLQSPEAMDALITAMSDSSAYVQLAIVRALNVIKRGTTRISSRTGINIISDSELDELDLKMLDVIINALQNENYRNRSLAIRIISGIFVAEKSFDALIAAAKDENPEIRMEVVHALGKINDPRVIQILIAALKDEDISVRMTAARELGRIRDIRENLPEETAQQQKEPLTALQKEKTEDIQKSAVEQSGKIEGYVTDKNTGKPLAGVNIFLNDTTYARKDSIPLSGITTFTYDEIINMSVSNLRRLLETHSGINVLTNTPYISKNQPIAFTDENGYYIIRNVPPGIYSLIAKKEGYFSNVRDNVRVETGKTTRLDFNLTEEVEDIQIEVIQLSKPSGKIDGYVKDKNSNQPLIGATISINGTSLRAQTDEKGYFVVPNVPHGIYSVSASRIGYLKLTSARLRVTEGMTVTINYRLTALKEVGKIHGYVTDKNTGKPLAGVNIFLNDITSARKDSIPLSRIKTLSYEEITRMPVSDLSKLLATQSNITILKDTLTKKILDRTSRVTTLSYEEIIKMPVSDLSKLLATQSSIHVLTNTPVKKGGYEARDVQDIRMRGGRNEEVALVIDGQAVRNPIFGGFSTSAEQSNILARPIAVTDEYGYFVIPNVPPGIYSLTASKTGYKSQTQENVRVTVGVITQLPFEMTVIKEAAESVQDTEHKQEYTATVLLTDSTIKKLDNVNFIIPDRVRMSTESTTLSSKNIEIIPSKVGLKLQKMVIIKSETSKMVWSSSDKSIVVLETTVHVKIYYDEGKVITDARFFYDSNSKIMVKGIDESTKKEWSVELDKIKEIVFALK